MIVYRQEKPLCSLLAFHAPLLLFVHTGEAIMQSPCFLCIAFTVCARRRSHYAVSLLFMHRLYCLCTQEKPLCNSAVSSAITTPRTAKWRGNCQLRFVVLRREKPALLRIPRFLSLTLHHVCIGVLALEHTDRFGSNSLDLWFFVERVFSQLRISLKW